MLTNLHSHQIYTPGPKTDLECHRDRMHALLAVVVPLFFPSDSMDDETWWEIRQRRSYTFGIRCHWVWTTKISNSHLLFNLTQTDKWVIWKTTDMVFQITHLYLVPHLKQEDFHQIIRLLHENRVKQPLIWTFKIKSWWHKGDRWVSNHTIHWEGLWMLDQDYQDIPEGVQDSI